MIFTVIVPVYNVENYVEQCVHSIQKQDFDDYEILLIDDGSTDNSGMICDLLSKENKKIRVFHKKNGGLSDARNYGISKAQGKYCIFVDSDDWIAEDCLKELSKIIAQDSIDVILTRLTYWKNGEIIERDKHLMEYSQTPLDKKRAVEWIIKYSEDTWPAVKLIVNRNLIEKCNIQFAVGRVHEDEDWTRKICYHAESYSAYINNWYFYRIGRENSITKKISAKNFIDPIEMASEHIKYCQENDIEMKDIIIERTIGSVFNIINRINECDKKEIGKIAECIRENKEVFRIAPKFKYKIFLVFMNVLGIEKALILLRTLNIIKNRLRY